MADHASQPAHAPEHAPQHAHPGARAYLGIAVVLTAITALEVGVFYMRFMHPVLVPVLLTLSALKFALVAMWYMHLKFDHRIFSWLFVTPMVIASLVIIALLRLFGHW